MQMQKYDGSVQNKIFALRKHNFEISYVAFENKCCLDHWLQSQYLKIGNLISLTILLLQFRGFKFAPFIFANTFGMSRFQALTKDRR